MAVYLGSNKVVVKGGTFNTDGTSINNQNKTVTPTTSQQTITADSGYTGLGTVTVNRIPTNYIIPSGNKEITANGTGIDVTAYATVSVAVPGGGSTPETMTLPTSTSGSATSGYTSKATISRSTSTQYLNIPPGYLSSGAYYTISATPNGTVTAPSSISGTTATVSTGTNTLTLTKTVSVTPNVTTAGYISSGTAGNSSVSLTANVTTKAAATITPGTSNQTIASGTYLTGTQTISGDANLIAGNIKSGISIFGVAGSYTGSGGSGGIGELISTNSLGTISTTSTTATSVTSISVSNINSYDALLVDCSVNTVTNGRHTSTCSFVWLTASSSSATKNGAGVCTARYNTRISSTGVTTTVQGTTAYGVYVNSCSISNGTVTIAIYRRYNSTSTTTINGTYTARVYGIKLVDLIGG